MRKNTFIPFLSFFMAILLAALPSLQVFAKDAQNAGEYISEVKIGVGKTADEAVKSLDGYTVLQKNGKNADLNEGAGGGIGSKGERVVYLGYKTTTNRKEAITDLAVMNMKGGYSVKDYEVLMERYMTEQVIPFVDGFLSAIKEYRINYNSEYPENKARAKYVHDALNKLTDDDCGGAGLGDLLLNETKYEMGDAAYDALSENEKLNHADILTIITQANGTATLLMENLVTRAADTSEDRWLDRFVGTTYEDLLGLYPDMLPSDAEAQLASDYDDDAREILSMWSAFAEGLGTYAETKAKFDELSAKDLTGLKTILDNYDEKTATEEQTDAYLEALAEYEYTVNTLAALLEDITIKEYLDTVEYGDGTLTDFFTQDYETVAGDITVLYPLVASLSAGQRAGLQFVTLGDLILFSETNAESYKDADIGSVATASVYDGVDRGIYKAGGVALTSDALRTNAAEMIASEDSKLSKLSYILLGVSAVTVAAFAVTALIRIGDALITHVRKYIIDIEMYNRKIEFSSVDSKYRALRLKLYGNDENKGILDCYAGRSPVLNKCLIGFGIAMIVFSAVALYFSYRDLVDYYNVEYSPIPKYIVDEKDITAYNNKGEKIVIKNQAAYYKVVETTRAESDEWFEILGTSGDLNGTVGRQWLALYAARNENESPILASSLKVVVGSDDVPADYTTGIHMFGSDAAYNLNNTQLVWNNDAKSTYVYFGVEDASGAGTAGSSFSAGYFILAGVIGLLAGAAITIGVSFGLKKKKNAAAK